MRSWPYFEEADLDLPSSSPPLFQRIATEVLNGSDGTEDSAGANAPHPAPA
jgi:hypothetical protein